jgi:hypothetical protein
MIVVDLELPESSVDAHHEVCIAPINSEELDYDVKELWMFILKLPEMFSDGEKAVPSNTSGKINSLFGPISHDFALQ